VKLRMYDIQLLFESPLILSQICSLIQSNFTSTITTKVNIIWRLMIEKRMLTTLLVGSVTWFAIGITGYYSVGLLYTISKIIRNRKISDIHVNGYFFLATLTSLIAVSGQIANYGINYLGYTNNK
jgi:hypothetical protein